MKIEIARCYEIVNETKNTPRFLVDRLWPRGLKKEALQLDMWVRDLSPSDALRKWYGHEPAKWEAFTGRYFGELDEHPEAVSKFLAAIKDYSVITLLYSSTEKEINNAVALKKYLLQHLK
ncbi:hypothetical protein BEL04_19460 [Mucilaginibacter sp. PPCGB 2223]|uniref:DUF488 domain-containing protein n=1 Tax=Mucilaginibacter sp. PPCGB 2223 TaxID=1886027 RepID=UPI0008241305|nr:DUF488 family protein [Mucilaginibacter sp. PPCGB 2223]OCX50903.1 hypothetical protein BEL04_19460 [Mucilaginibacter sp. PPCGB 2223]